MRTRVASSDWWASRKVVSVTAAASARAAGGELLGTHLEQELPGPGRGGDGEVDGTGSLVAGSSWTGASPCGWLTVTSAR